MSYTRIRRGVTPAQRKMLNDAERIETRERILRCGVVTVMVQSSVSQIERAVVRIAFEEAALMAKEAEEIRDKVWNPRSKKTTK